MARISQSMLVITACGTVRVLLTEWTDFTIDSPRCQGSNININPSLQITYEHPLVDPHTPHLWHEPLRTITDPQLEQVGASPKSSM
jgi:hypothetical protein